MKEKYVSVRMELVIAKTLVNIINAARLGDDETGERVVCYIDGDSTIRRGRAPTVVQTAVG